MAYIRTIEPDDATPELAELYRRVANRDGTIDNVMRIHGLNPESLRTHFDMYAAALHRPSPLTRVEREMVAVVISRLNGCTYCLRHHGAGLKTLIGKERHRDADCLATGRLVDLPKREAAIVAYATKLTTNPQAMDPTDVATLRAAGLDDRAILDLAQIIGYFNYVNRIVLGLGVQEEGGEFQIGQGPANAG
ncbi:MAG: peroxidase-related enzyme [Phycisphaerales bacterium]|nr:peroxidase-related enzyme [Phycisphaerae bacterium]NNF44118.1 peroxidase-related enzyme [Phycisphaerales bacterium]NNM24776.1 peroxidase-related enzyme [Phycisphaerales bacterium]